MYLELLFKFFPSIYRHFQFSG